LYHHPAPRNHVESGIAIASLGAWGLLRAL
jgi:hypothetical protein